MEIKRAIEILNPEHRECYNGIEEVNEACRMGMAELEARREAEEVLTSARQEMAIYEAAVDKWGKEGTARAAANAFERLLVTLRRIEGGAEESDLDKEARAEAEISLNLLTVLLGDCSDLECVKLDNLKDMVSE